MALCVNGNEIMRDTHDTHDTHEGWTGDPRKNPTYKLNPGAMVFNGHYETEP